MIDITKLTSGEIAHIVRENAHMWDKEDLLTLKGYIDKALEVVQKEEEKEQRPNNSPVDLRMGWIGQSMAERKAELIEELNCLPDDSPTKKVILGILAERYKNV